MTGPKHLWSGNWQAESSQQDAAPTEPGAPIPPQRADPLPVRRPERRRPWRGFLPLAAVVLVAGAALAAVLSGGTPGRVHRGATTPTASVVPNSQLPNPVLPAPSTTPTTSAGNTISGRPVTWLGMQISTENGTAVIQTVQLGSPADAAGLDPGDIIQTVNGHPITAAGQIRGAVRDLTTGRGVPISVIRGSAFFSTVADFAGPPTSP